MEKYKRRRQQERFDDIKHTMEKIEMAIEVLILMTAYYVMWKYQYSTRYFTDYYASGRYTDSLSLYCSGTVRHSSSVILSWQTYLHHR